MDVIYPKSSTKKSPSSDPLSVRALHNLITHCWLALSTTWSLAFYSGTLRGWRKECWGLSTSQICFVLKGTQKMTFNQKYQVFLGKLPSPKYCVTTTMWGWTPSATIPLLDFGNVTHPLPVSAHRGAVFRSHRTWFRDPDKLLSQLTETGFRNADKPLSQLPQTGFRDADKSLSQVEEYQEYTCDHSFICLAEQGRIFPGQSFGKAGLWHWGRGKSSPCLSRRQMFALESSHWMNPVLKHQLAPASSH